MCKYLKVWNGLIEQWFCNLQCTSTNKIQDLFIKYSDATSYSVSGAIEYRITWWCQKTLSSFGYRHNDSTTSVLSIMTKGY